MLVLWNNDGIDKQLLHKDYPKFYSLYVLFLESKMKVLENIPVVTVLYSVKKQPPEVFYKASIPLHLHISFIY